MTDKSARTHRTDNDITKMSVTFTKMDKKKRKELLCKFKDHIYHRKKQAKAFKLLTESTLKENINRLQQICWGRNRRRLQHSKPSKLPNQDTTSLLNCYNRLVQFRMQPVEMLWLELVRMVSLMIGVYGAMQKRGCMLERLTYRNIMDQYKTAVNINDLGVDSNAMNVNYNYKDYAAARKISVSTAAVKIMLKNENLRTHEDIMAIYLLMMDFPVFQNNYSHNLMWALAKNLKYFKCEAKRVLTAKNRNPIRVYFIYSGTVSVMVESEDTVGSVKRTISLSRGSCIGHTAKSSHCICTTDCEFLTIDKSVYISEGIHAVESKKMEERFDFFRNWPPLEDWSDNAIYDVASLSYTDSYPSGTLILEDRLDSEFDLMWFVLSGKIDVVKVVSQQSFKLAVENNKGKNSFKMGKRGNLSRLIDVTLKNVKPKKRKNFTKCQKNDKNPPSIYTFHYMSSHLLDKSTSENLAVKKDLDTPIYLRMRTLCQGECYGLDNIEDERIKLTLTDDRRSTNRFCLVSRDCVVIRLSCSHFKGLGQILGVNRQELVKAMHSYYDDEKIYNVMKNELDWMRFKQASVEALTLRNPTVKKERNFDNHLKHTSNNLLLAAYNQPNYMTPLKKVSLIVSGAFYNAFLKLSAPRKVVIRVN